MDRNTKKVLQYMEDMEKEVKQMKFISFFSQGLTKEFFSLPCRLQRLP